MVQIDIGLTSRGEEVESSSALLHSGSSVQRGVSRRGPGQPPVMTLLAGE